MIKSSSSADGKPPGLESSFRAHLPGALESEPGHHLWEGTPPPAESDYPRAPPPMAGGGRKGRAGAPEVGLRALPRQAQMVFFFFISVSIGFFLL